MSRGRRDLTLSVYFVSCSNTPAMLLHLRGVFVTVIAAGFNVQFAPHFQNLSYFTPFDSYKPTSSPSSSEVQLSSQLHRPLLREPEALAGEAGAAAEQCPLGEV